MRSLLLLRLAVLLVCCLATTNARGQAVPDGPLARYAGNPLLAKGPAGSYDSLKIGPRTILREAPTVWKMWYEAVPGGNQSTAAYATSTDGLVWTKYAGNPVMSPSVAWEGAGGTNHESSPTTVLKEDGLYKLWYHGISNTARQVGYAESIDGLNWTKYAGNPVLTPGPAGAWDADSVCEPRVVHAGAQYYMFYTRCVGSHGIGLATSADGKSWTKYAGNPVLTVGAAGAWDDLQVSWGEVYYDGQRFFMWYPGRKSTDSGGFSLGVATSSDGRTWTRSANNPVMTPPSQALNKGDDLGVESSPTVVRMGGTMRVYYGGFRSCCPEDTTVCLSTTTASGVANRAPIVDAGRDQNISAGATATLDGTVMDDDAPVALASVQSIWSKQSGPGTVTFGAAGAIDTTATFSTPGTYVLVLTASDTALTSTDTATIVVAGGGSGGAGGGTGGTGGSGGIGGGGGRGGTGGTGGSGGIGGAAGSGGGIGGTGGVSGASGRGGASGAAGGSGGAAGRGGAGGVAGGSGGIGGSMAATGGGAAGVGGGSAGSPNDASVDSIGSDAGAGGGGAGGTNGSDASSGRGGGSVPQAPDSTGGCGCEMGGAGTGHSSLLFVVSSLLVGLRHRRRRRR